MAIPYRFLDFVPDIKGEGLVSRTLETVQETVVRANEWITRSGVRVVNIETVVLPVNTGDDGERRTGGNDFVAGDRWLMQVVRVWYTEST